MANLARPSSNRTSGASRLDVSCGGILTIQILKTNICWGLGNSTKSRPISILHAKEQRTTTKINEHKRILQKNN